MPAPRRRRLVELTIKESSGVDKPANYTQVGGDGWMVQKGDKPFAKALATCTEAGCNLKVMPGASKCPDGHPQETPTKKGAPVGDKDKTEKTDAEKAAEKVALDKALESLPEPVREMVKAQGEALKAMQDELEKAKAEKDAAASKTDEQREAEKAAELAKAMETLPPAVRASLEKQAEEAKQLRKDADEAKEIAKAERDKRLDAEFVAKAEDLGQPGSFGPVLRRISEGTAEKADHEELERVLRAANEQSKASELLRIKGVNLHKADDDTTAYGRIVGKAKELQKAAVEKGETLDLNVAIDKVVQMDPALKADYDAEVRA
jgi:hypothetical protein